MTQKLVSSVPSASSVEVLQHTHTQSTTVHTVFAKEEVEFVYLLLSLCLFLQMYYHSHKIRVLVKHFVYLFYSSTNAKTT